jgi:hypothetical protein
MRRVQWATPLTSGGKDSATIAIRTFTKVNYEVSPQDITLVMC